MKIIPDIYFLLLEYLYLIQYNSEYIFFFNQKKIVFSQKKVTFATSPFSYLLWGES